MGKKYNKDCKGGEDCFEESHLCKIAGRKDFELVKDLVKDSRYFCKKCGRAARNDANLCKPTEI